MFHKPLSSPWSLLAAVLACIDTVTSQNHYPLIGVKTGVDPKTGYRPPRREIKDLVNDLPQWSLYVQAMNQMMQVNETTLTSFFQIGGIHGLPYISWDDVNPTSPDAGIPIGYCTHGNVLFPTWHRPYLSLIEQVMAGFAQTIAKGYRSATYTKAADELRFPFWDWAALPQRFPDVMTWPSVRINTPTGLKNVTNPLYRYEFLNHPEPEEWFPTKDGDAWMAEQPWTVRNADANNQSQFGPINSNLADDGPFLTTQVWNTFAKVSNFNTMASGANGGSSFESPHNTIHIFVGGRGHMSPVTYSGFDPCFFLHHANVDRQFAMWQAIYPDSWMVPEISTSGTWTIFPNTLVDDKTPLTPFTTGDKKTPWTSASARYTKSFGYSYPDVQDWLPRTAAQLSANVTARVNQLYNPNGVLTRRSSSMRIRGSSLMERATEKVWSVNVAVPNAALGEAFYIDVVVGDVTLGKLVILSAPSKVELDAGAKRVSYGEYPLTAGLAGVAEDDVVEYLKANLKFRVIKTADGTSVPAGQVKGLKVEVVDEIVTPAEDISKFPTFGKKTSHPEITP